MILSLFVSAIEDDDVVKPKDFESHQQFWLRLGEVSEDDLDVDVSHWRGLDSIDHAEEMVAVVVIGAGKSNSNGSCYLGCYPRNR